MLGSSLIVSIASCKPVFNLLSTPVLLPVLTNADSIPKSICSAFLKPTSIWALILNFLADSDVSSTILFKLDISLATSFILLLSNLLKFTSFTILPISS